MKKLLLLTALTVAPWAQSFAASDAELKSATTILLMQLDALTTLAAPKATIPLQPGSEQLIGFEKGLGEAFRTTNTLNLLVEHKIDDAKEQEACEAINGAALAIHVNIESSKLMENNFDALAPQIMQLQNIEQDLFATCDFEHIDTTGKIGRFTSWMGRWEKESPEAKYKVEAVEQASGKISHAIRIIHAMLKALNPQLPM